MAIFFLGMNGKDGNGDKINPIYFAFYSFIRTFAKNFEGLRTSFNILRCMNQVATGSSNAKELTFITN